MLAELCAVLGLIVVSIIFLFAMYIAFVLWRYRQEPFDSTDEAFNQLPDGLEIRKLSHGVAFLPRTAGSNVGLVYLQGALVHSHAYAPLCREIAQLTGSAVILMELPLRMAFFRNSRISEATSQVSAVHRWVVGGHSLGGSIAAKFVVNSKKGHSGGQNQLLSSQVVGCLMHASYAAGSNMADCSDISVLQLLGDQDGIVNAKRLEESNRDLPSSSVVKNIAGCNHSGFGHYGPQVFPKRDGEATYSKTELQHTIAELTATWLKAL